MKDLDVLSLKSEFFFNIALEVSKKRISNFISLILIITYSKIISR